MIARIGWVTGRLRRVAAVFVALLALAAPAAAHQGQPTHWVGTWAASAQPDSKTTLNNQTVRNVVHVSLGGGRLSLRLTNAYGGNPLAAGDAFGESGRLFVTKVDVGLATPGSAAVRPGTNRSVTFDGETGLELPAGADAWSDPVDLAVPDRADLAVSIYVQGPTPNATFHSLSNQTSYLAAGDHAADESPGAFAASQPWFLLDAISVQAPARVGAVATFGDSITDGYLSTPNTNRRWPDVLAARLARAHWPVRGVLNEGISGNEIVRDQDCCGGNPSAQSRFRRDVLSQDGVRDVILLEGINDLGHYPDGKTTAAEVIRGMRHLVSHAHRAGLRIIGGTILPFKDTTLPDYYSPAKDVERQKINQFIRTSGAFDGVIDFDRVMRDPADPLKLRAVYDSGDHLHPNDAGYRAMGQAVDLRLLR
jgi:lysophospholipase L1-like esterase